MGGGGATAENQGVTELSLKRLYGFDHKDYKVFKMINVDLIEIIQRVAEVMRLELQKDYLIPTITIMCACIPAIYSKMRTILCHFQTLCFPSEDLRRTFIPPKKHCITPQLLCTATKHQSHKSGMDNENGGRGGHTPTCLPEVPLAAS